VLIAVRPVLTCGALVCALQPDTVVYRLIVLVTCIVVVHTHSHIQLLLHHPLTHSCSLIPINIVLFHQFSCHLLSTVNTVITAIKFVGHMFVVVKEIMS